MTLCGAFRIGAARSRGGAAPPPRLAVADAATLAAGGSVVVDVLANDARPDPVMLVEVLGAAAAGARPVEIAAGQDIQPVVDANPAGTTYRLGAGVHRLQYADPKDGDVFVFAPGAVMNGSIVVANWVDQGDSTWASTGHTVAPFTHGEGLEGALYGDDMFIDDVPLTHVRTLGEVGPGKYFFDYDADTIHLGSDPTGRTVELATEWAAFYPTAERVTIIGAVVEKYKAMA